MLPPQKQGFVDHEMVGIARLAGGSGVAIAGSLREAKKPFPDAETTFWEPETRFRTRRRLFGNKIVVSGTGNDFLEAKKPSPDAETTFGKPENRFRVRKRLFENPRASSQRNTCGWLLAQRLRVPLLAHVMMCQSRKRKEEAL